jgi:hypothetical protein
VVPAAAPVAGELEQVHRGQHYQEPSPIAMTNRKPRSISTTVS